MTMAFIKKGGRSLLSLTYIVVIVITNVILTPRTYFLAYLVEHHELYV